MAFVFAFFQWWLSISMKRMNNKCIINRPGHRPVGVAALVKMPTPPIEKVDLKGIVHRTENFFIPQ